jgi:AcrR family transcriptional regulator
VTKRTRAGRPDASADTALRVVRAARAAFAAHGYGGASMRTIAAEVGVTAMALYNYAPSKAALLQLVFDETMTEVYGSLGEAVAGQESMVAEVHAILERSGEILQDDPDLLHFLIRVILDRQQDELNDLELLAPPVVAFFDGLIERAVSRQELARRDGPRLATFVTMLLWGIIALAASDPTSIGHAVETAKWAAVGRLM